MCMRQALLALTGRTCSAPRAWCDDLESWYFTFKSEHLGFGTHVFVRWWTVWKVTYQKRAVR